MIDFSKILRDLKRVLYPTGRAWNLKKGSVFQKLHEGLSVSESEVANASLDLLDSILPDNDGFDTEDALKWENALGLPESPDVDLEVRKTSIIAKMNYPNNLKARQHWNNFQGFLRARGFDVYVHENRFWNGSGYDVIDPRGSIYNTFNYSQQKYSQSAFAGGYELCANYIDSVRDQQFNIGNETALRGTFYIGGAVFGERADIDYLRKDEFRQMILQLKPCQTVAILLINYTGDSGAQFTDGSNFQFTDGTNLEFTDL